MKLDFDPKHPGGKDILLFYREHETDRFLPGDRYLKRLIRPLYDRLHHNQKVTGFGVSFNMLARGLTEAGYTVHRNDYALARANPTYPIGIVGGPVLLEDWRLPNPTILGPSIYDQPGQAPQLFDDERFQSYLCLADWMYDLFETQYAGRCVKWYAGIDTEAWPDLSRQPKDLDFLIYDKVRWDHDHYQGALIDPILGELSARGLTSELIRYRFHDHETFKSLLGRAKGLLFLCENETQGIAYQEAMASNVPVLAWDRGYWADPQWKQYLPEAPWASAVPFFSPECGERFVGMEDFGAKLDTFQTKRDAYRPRHYVTQDLSIRKSGEIYAKAYFEAGAKAAKKSGKTAA